MNSFMLKVIALVAMLVDHVGKVFYRSAWWMTYVGRLAFPIFAYQTAVGWRRTRDVRKYIERLAVLAVMSQVPYSLLMMMLGDDVTRLNVGCTLLMAVAMLTLVRKVQGWWKVVPIVAACMVAELTKMDYGAYGVAVVALCAGLDAALNSQRLGRRRLALITAGIVATYAVMTMLRYLPGMVQYPAYGALYGWQMVWAILALIVVLAHNGWRGPAAKRLFYIFYPAHLVALYIIYILVQ